MDDANVPNLLSIPYLGYTSYHDEIYKNTRKFSLSTANPWFNEGNLQRNWHFITLAKIKFGLWFDYASLNNR